MRKFKSRPLADLHPNVFQSADYPGLLKVHPGKETNGSFLFTIVDIMNMHRTSKYGHSHTTQRFNKVKRTVICGPSRTFGRDETLREGYLFLLWDSLSSKINVWAKNDIVYSLSQSPKSYLLFIAHKDERFAWLVWNDIHKSPILFPTVHSQMRNGQSTNPYESQRVCHSFL